MLAKYTIAGLAGSALLASVAFAQTPATTTDRANTAPASPTAASPASASNESSFHGTWRTSKLVGLYVYNDSNESLGTINDLLTDKSGNIKAVVLGVGGFLGVGTQLIAVPLDKIKFVNEPIAYTGVAGAPNRPSSNTSPSPPTTTGAATSKAPAAASKPNPWYPDHAVLSATKDQLKAMAEFNYSTN